MGCEREREDRAAVGHRHAGPGVAVQTGFETKIQIQMVQNIFKPFQNWLIRKVLSLTQKN
jgi:hypothetical protein